MPSTNVRKPQKPPRKYLYHVNDINLAPGTKLVSLGDFQVPIIRKIELKTTRKKAGAEGKLVGAGRYGEVRLMRYKGDLVAIKSLVPSTTLEDLASEIEMMLRLNYTEASPKLIGLHDPKGLTSTTVLTGLTAEESIQKASQSGLPYGWPDANFRPEIVMEFIGDTQREKAVTLAELIDKKIPYTINDWVVLFEKMCSKLDQIHRSEIFHCDIKPDNIILKPMDKGRFDPFFVDFGLSQDSSLSYGVDLEGDSSSTYIRDHPYTDPEIVKDKEAGFSETTDVYALCRVFEVCCRGRPRLRKVRELASTVMQTPGTRRPSLSTIRSVLVDIRHFIRSQASPNTQSLGSNKPTSNVSKLVPLHRKSTSTPLDTLAIPRIRKSVSNPVEYKPNTVHRLMTVAQN